MYTNNSYLACSEDENSEGPHVDHVKIVYSTILELGRDLCSFGPIISGSKPVVDSPAELVIDASTLAMVIGEEVVE